MFFPACHKKSFTQRCPHYQQSHSMEAWRMCGKPLAGDYFMFGFLVPASDMTWWLSPFSIGHSSLALCTCHLLSLPLPILLLRGIFILIFTALTMAWRVWGCPRQISCQLKRVIIVWSLKRTFILRWLVLPFMDKCQTKVAWEKGTWCLWVSTVFPLFIFSWVNMQCYSWYARYKLEAWSVEIT